MATKDIELLESPGVVRDTPPHKLNDAAFSDGENIRFGDEGAEALTNDIETFSSAGFSPLWLQFFPPITAPLWVYASLTEVWVVENTTHTEITRVSGDYTAVAEERWQSAILNGIGVFNNSVDIPQAWNPIDSGTPLIDLPNWDSNRRAKCIRSFKNFLIALNMTDSGVNRPYRILWSDSADAGTVPGSWDSTDPTTDSREFDLAETSDYLVDQLPLGDVNIVYKENSVWGMQYIGPPFYFRFWKILSKNGLLHRDCVANVPFGHAVVTQDDIILHSGQVENFKSILTKSQRRWLFSAIDPSSFYNSFLVADPQKGELYFCFPELGSTYATMALIWNWRDKNIGFRTLLSIPFAATGPVGASIIDDVEWGV